MAIRKNSQQIKEEILSHLKKSPSSTKKLSGLLKSNWSTINTHLEELKREGSVREIYSKENLKIYVRTDYPVFYGFPLSKNDLNDSLFLLSEIIKLWKEKKGDEINKTTMQKIAVNIVKNNPSLNIPVVRFHYGKVLTAHLEQDSYQDILQIYDIKQPNNHSEITESIEKEIKSENYSNIAWKDRRRQYEKYGEMEVFLIKEKLSHLFIKKENDSKKMMDLFYGLFLKIPSTEKYSYLFEKYHDFISATDFILNSNQFNKGDEEKKRNYLKEISETFNSLWQALTTEFFFEDIESVVNEEFQSTMQLIKDSKIKTYYFEIEEKLNNLSEYKKMLTPKRNELDKEEKEIKNILLEGANEE